MTVSLDTAFVATCLQQLRSLSALLDRAEAHCRDKGLDPQALMQARLAPDMWHFAKQVFETGHHSARAIEAVRSGLARPELHEVPTDLASLRAAVAASIATLEAVAPGELDAVAGGDVRFEIGPRHLDFTVADFLLSFSLPNFFFHAGMAYAILRNQDVEIGKLNFLGSIRIKT